MNMNNIELHLYLRLDRRQKSKRNVRVSTSQREQYEGIVHLFIGCWGLVLKCYELRTRQHRKNANR
jgi:hypothetical protein